MVYFPRNGYNLWNTRYFILPRLLILDDVDRGSFTLFVDRQGKQLPVIKEWSVHEDDCVVLENTEALPRAWIVHEVEIFPEIHDLRRSERADRMEKLLYRSQDGGMSLWQGRRYGDYPVRHRAMVETDDPASIESLKSLRSEAHLRSAIDPKFIRWDSDDVALETSTTDAGFLVLADAYFPGWSATIDGKQAPVLRANRAMRGVFIPKGDHLVEFRYRSRPFEMGAIVSAATLAGLTMTHFFLRRRKGITPTFYGEDHY